MEITLKDFHSNDKPRERLIEFGEAALADSELLSIVLRSGGSSGSVTSLSRRLLKEFGGIKGLLDANFTQLTLVKDIGVAKAACIKAVCEISKRMMLPEKTPKQVIASPKDVFGLVQKDLFGKTREYLVLVSLNSKNVLISLDIISIGTITETLVHPREVFRQALLRNATSIILVHNHPSGVVTPSQEDMLLTQKVFEAGKHVGINLVDHVIVSNLEYSSMKNLGAFCVKGLVERR